MPETETLRYESGGATMVYTRSGVPGRAFVLVHGIGMGQRVFGDLATELGRTGTVYAVDLPGFGDSPEPGSAYSMEVSGDFLAGFIRDLDLADPVVIGHSMGTEVTVEAVARHPWISSCIVLIAPTVNRRERTVARQAVRMLQDLAGESPKVLGLGLVQYAKTGPRWFVRKLGFMLEHRVEETYPRVQAHALVLRGAKDRVCPRDWVQEVADLIPHATYTEVPGRGHEAMIRGADPVASLIVEHAEATPHSPGR